VRRFKGLLPTAATAAAVAIVACGGNGDPRAEIISSYEELTAAVLDRDAPTVCHGLTPRAREHVGLSGHLTSPDCVAGMRPMLQALARGREAPRAHGRSDIDVAEISLRAVATMSIDGRRVKVPFAEQDGEWKLDSFYGLSPRPSVALP
jgi:hypothetical protein